MIGQTLGIYFALRFVKVMLGLLLTLLCLIVAIDFIEQLRKVTENSDISLIKLYQLSMLRTPIFLEQALPFVCLFAAMITLAQLNQKMELAVTRAAGVSAWQFLLPFAISAGVTGILATTLYNPLAVKASNQAEELAAELFHGKSTRRNTERNNVWIKQQMDSASAIINASNARQEGKFLDDVRIIEFDDKGFVASRIDAENAIFKESHWILKNVLQSDGRGETWKLDSLIFPTNLTADSIFSATGDPEAVSFWELASTAERVMKSGANPGPYLMRRHSLVALPVFLAAMTLIAGAVSLRFVRSGHSGHAFLAGISGGFVLYAAIKLMTSLGSNGIVPPAMAAWAPCVVAILFGASALLRQEDG